MSQEYHLCPAWMYISSPLAVSRSYWGGSIPLPVAEGLRDSFTKRNHIVQNILNIWTIAYHIRHGPSAFQMSPAHYTVRTASPEIGQSFARPGCHGSWTMCVSGSGGCNGCPWTSGPSRRSTDGRNRSLASVLGPLATTLEWHWLLFIVFLLL